MAIANQLSSQQKKDKPKPVAAAKGATETRQGRGRGRARGGRAGRGGREGNKKKTVEELDAEMDDYFPATDGANDAMATNGNAVVATGLDDTNMVDEML
jgi:THO complex subunit 4